MVALLARGWTGPNTAAVLAAPLLVAGCGCGLVIAANQTLALHEIIRVNAGLAAAIYQTGERIGTALGTAAVQRAVLRRARHYRRRLPRRGRTRPGHSCGTGRGGLPDRHGGHPVADAPRRRGGRPIRSGAVYC
jgi:hypothetical protein